MSSKASHVALNHLGLNETQKLVVAEMKQLYREHIYLLLGVLNE